MHARLSVHSRYSRGKYSERYLTIALKINFTNIGRSRNVEHIFTFHNNKQSKIVKEKLCNLLL